MTEPTSPSNGSANRESDSAPSVGPLVAKKRKWLKVLAVGLPTALLVIALLVRVWFGTLVHRFYGFAIYCNALRYYQESIGDFPPSIEALEEAYNQFDGRRVTFGEDPTPRRPDVHPPPPGCHGPFLVMIERIPEHWYQRMTRYVIYACGDSHSTGDAQVRYDDIWVWRLDDLLRQDDALRQECRPATP
jgi:hypothetical protein